MSMDLRQSTGWAKYLKAIGFEVEEVAGQKAYIKKIPLLGSVIKIQRPLKIPPAAALDQLAKKHRALFIKLEPLAANHSAPAGFEPDPNPNLPTKTLIIDLAQSEQELWKNLSKDARQSVRKAQNEGLAARSYKYETKEFEDALGKFHKLLIESGKRGNFWVTPFKDLKFKVRSLGQDAILFLVYPLEGQNNGRALNPLASALVFLTGGTAFFHHIGSSIEGQKLFAPYFLIWEIIRFLKDEEKIRWLDLEGIADPRFPQTAKWEGFTVFKRKWGGKEFEYPRPLIKHYSPITKVVFSLAQALERTLIRS